jgi:putative transposase
MKLTLKLVGKIVIFIELWINNGNTIDFLLTKRRMKGSAQNFSNKAIGNNDKPRVINTGKSGSNKEGIKTFNKRNFKNVKWRQCKYLNNIVEQDYRNVKRRITITTGFKEFESAQRTLAGIEVANIIRKNQIIDPKSITFKTFNSLAA